MPDLLRILALWWKRLLLLAAIAVAIALVLLMLKPKLYLSVATALPANSATFDKARIFNPNIQHLYPELGNPDELDKFLGIAELESLYRQLAIENNLAPHYHIKGINAAYKAALKLRTRITVIRSKWNDLKVKAWDEDPRMAAHLANAFLQKAEALYQKLQQQNNRILLQRLQHDLATKEQQLQQAYAPAANAGPEQWNNIRTKTLEQQVSGLQQLVDQYTLTIQTPLPLLLIAESAVPAFKPDSPKVLQTAAIVLFAALAFGFLAAIFIESIKHHAP